MNRISKLALALACAIPVVVQADEPAASKPPATAEIIAQSKPADWRPLDPENTLYLELASGRVVMELAPEFAPKHVANVKALAREGYFDGLAFLRSQDNYVVQWGDAPENEKDARPMKSGISMNKFRSNPTAASMSAAAVLDHLLKRTI